jgi:ABC-type nitrate/sulfonate/bicarbonate transport system substrate-binding protein
MRKESAMRRSGIEVMGEVPWGTHFRQFCETSSRVFLKGGHMPKTITTLLIVAAFVLTGMVGCSRKEQQDASKQHEKITLAVTPWPGSAPFYIAHEKGYFRDEGLDVTLHSYISGQLGLAAVLSGKADFATAGETPIARAALDGKPIAVLATVCEIHRAILIIARKDRGISTADDLRGKNIGLAAGTTAEFFLHIYLTTSYIDPKDVRIVNIAPEKVVDALLNGEVDAVSTWAPYTTVLRDKLGTNALVLDEPGIYTMTWNIAATQDFVKNNSQRIRKFLRAILRANRFITEQPAETRVITSKNIGTDRPLFGREWKDYKFTVVLAQSLILNLEDQARWMIEREAGSGQRPPNFMDFIYTDGLKAVLPEAVRIAGR